jgi:hypothetical protein
VYRKSALEAFSARLRKVLANARWAAFQPKNERNGRAEVCLFNSACMSHAQITKMRNCARLDPDSDTATLICPELEVIHNQYGPLLAVKIQLCAFASDN